MVVAPAVAAVSVLKESLLLCCIGLFLYASLKLFLEKFKPTLLLLAIVNLIILFMLKVYVILAFIPCLSVYLLVRKFDIKKIGLTYLTGFLIFYFLGDLVPRDFKKTLYYFESALGVGFEPADEYIKLIEENS